MAADKVELTRFGVSFPGALIEQFDRYIEELGYTNRSEAIRDMARKAMLEPARMNPEALVAGTIVMVYDHHISELPLVLTDLQHQHHHAIISTMHVHLNHAQCLEVIVVRGKVAGLRQLLQHIQVQKGVTYAELSVTYADEHGLPHDHGHGHEHGHGHGHSHEQ